VVREKVSPQSALQRSKSDPALGIVIEDKTNGSRAKVADSIEHHDALFSRTSHH
jgi:hypothetical protein